MQCALVTEDGDGGLSANTEQTAGRSDDEMEQGSIVTRRFYAK